MEQSTPENHPQMSPKTAAPMELDQGQDLNRSGSWKKFKKQVKQTVQGWVGGGSAESSMPNPGLPSAVFPSKEVKKASIDVNSVLNESNCYNYAPLNPEDLFPKESDPMADVPMIVVTQDTHAPVRPARRGSSKKTSQVITKPPTSTPPIEMVSPREPSVRTNEVGWAHTPPRHSSSPMRGPSSPPTTTFSSSPLEPVIKENSVVPNDQVKCDIAVMKIKQAIFAAKAGPGNSKDDSELLSPKSSALAERRLSDSAAIGPRSTTQTVAKGRPSEPSTTQSPSTSNNNGLLDPSIPHPSLLVRRKSTCETTGQPKVSKPVSRSSSMNRAASIKKQKAKPMIWDHFDSLPNTTQTGRCRACKMNVSCKFNTGNFVRHLQLAHQDVYRQYQNKMEANWTRSMLERNLK